ncbi:MAG: ketoacyl-ACP synthase III [Deltaproteobacteria bacterium]|nr:ketoacyl-ACP synthase III [Deltaproteobacteria bacterium]
MFWSRIVGTGSFVPPKVLTNRDLERTVETTDEWIRTRTGISERRVVVNETAADMGVLASKAALKAAGISPKDIDMVVVGTVTPDMTFPSTACLVQSLLGIKSGVPCFDVSAACSGFLYAVDVADKYIKTGVVKNALVIGVDLFSRLLDWKDRGTCVLFGDGAGAVVLTSTRGRHAVLSTHIHSDGRYWEMLYAPSAISPSPFEKRDQQRPYLKMQGNETFKLAVRTLRSACSEIIEKNGLRPEDIALLIPHQANMRIINAAKEMLKLADHQVYTNIERYGNTSAGSIPLALDEALRSNRIKTDDILIFIAFGGGFTWAGAAVRW